VFNLKLFIDGSVDTKTRIGFGAYLAVDEAGLSLNDLNAKVAVKRFDNTSSTTLELQTLLWAINDVLLLHSETAVQFVIYTDSQNIVGLLARRNKLEQEDYCANSGKRLNNASLYQQFFMVLDQCNCQIIKLAGHKPKNLKDDLDRVFALVDKAARSSLRKYNRATFESITLK